MSKRKQQTTLFTCWKRKPTDTENNDEERPPSVTDQEGKIQQEIDTGYTSQLKNNPVLSPQSKQQENSEHSLKDPVQEDVQTKCSRTYKKQHHSAAFIIKKLRDYPDLKTEKVTIEGVIKDRYYCRTCRDV